MYVGLKSGESISGVPSTGEIFGNFEKALVQKDEKKTHSIFHCDQTNISWFKIEGTNFGSPVHGEDQKWLWGRTRIRCIASFIVIR